MFNAGTTAPSLFEKQPFDHNLAGLEHYTSARDAYYGGHPIETTGHAFLDEIPAGKSLMDQFKEATYTQLDGSNSERGSDDLYRRLTMERRRSVSTGTVIERRAVSEDGRTHETPIKILEDDTATPPSGVLVSKLFKGKKPALPTKAVAANHRPTIARSFTTPLPTSASKKERCSSEEARVFPETDIPRLLLYNWFLLRMDNIKILSSLNDTFNGHGDDFGLLKLLVSTHEDRRWWTIMADDLACPQCVEVLKARRTDAKVRYLATRPKAKWADGAQKILRPRYLSGWIAKCSRTVHCDGGQCRVVCEHKHPKANNVTRFFSSLGLSTASRMRNILLETTDSEIPSVDHLVSCVQNVGYYFPDVQNLEICFHFGNLELDKDTWTRILCCLVDLESLLPKGAHLRVKGLEAHTELMCGWARRGRRWYHGKSDAVSLSKKSRSK